MNRLAKASSARNHSYVSRNGKNTSGSKGLRALHPYLQITLQQSSVDNLQRNVEILEVVGVQCGVIEMFLLVVLIYLLR